MWSPVQGKRAAVQFNCSHWKHYQEQNSRKTPQTIERTGMHQKEENWELPSRQTQENRKNENDFSNSENDNFIFSQNHSSPCISWNMPYNLTICFDLSNQWTASANLIWFYISRANSILSCSYSFLPVQVLMTPTTTSFSLVGLAKEEKLENLGTLSVKRIGLSLF